ncbi:MAG TPA: sn-glycerol-3-phosphate ABC transporter ATP-binding protein UgpC [Candidatus Thioglobus sp.]|jgi:alpha-glucoside transport system ATP-binding protein|nr:sn-glycerol-3-phosphate ABC transporter ATP-binding protein UgpC [Candidatus Thioglobus sp.]HIL42966.1 sn-glycerol-3-phosphate ABC transporter ATP-binding protein UgpC [Gammaproteobacteria bacterium]
MTQLKLISLEKSYNNGTPVLKNVSLDIQSGELIVFVGPSGCGKSTLLRMIAGLEQITDGTLEIDGQYMNDMPASKRGIAMVFQSYALYPHLTVRDNMSFALKIAKYKQSDIDAAVSKAAKALKLEDYLDRLPKELSGGQRQRVAIGRAIVRDPKVFLFDEPLSNLDAALRVETRIEIARLKESMPDRTMIYVTHDQVEAMTLASRIVVLANNTVEQVGTPLDLYDNPDNEFVAQFIGSPAMNLLPGEIVATGKQTKVKLSDNCVAVSNIVTSESDLGKQVNVGIRPEDLSLTEDDHVLEAVVDITEALGEYTLLYLKHVSHAANLVAKVPGTHKSLRNKLIKFIAKPSKIHIFHDGISMR